MMKTIMKIGNSQGLIFDVALMAWRIPPRLRKPLRSQS